MFHFQTFRGTILIKPKLSFISDPLWRGATAARARTTTRPPRPSDLKSRGLSEGPQEERDIHGKADGAWSHSEGPPHPGGRAKVRQGRQPPAAPEAPSVARRAQQEPPRSPHIAVCGRSGAGADALPCPTLRLSAPTSCATLGLRTGGRVNERPPSLPPSLRQTPGQQAGWGGDTLGSGELWRSRQREREARTLCRGHPYQNRMSRSLSPPKVLGSQSQPSPTGPRTVGTRLTPQAECAARTDPALRPPLGGGHVMANPGRHRGLILNRTGPRCPHTRAEGTRHTGARKLRGSSCSRGSSQTSAGILRFTPQQPKNAKRTCVTKIEKEMEFLSSQRSQHE